MNELMGVTARSLEQALITLRPAIIAAAIITFGWIAARLARWLVWRGLRAVNFDRWIRRTGLAAAAGCSGTPQAARFSALAVFWAIFAAAILAALDSLQNSVAAHIVQTAMVLLPRLAAAAAIVVVGFWIGQYLGRTVLVWAVNEDLPGARHWAVAVRVLVSMVAVVAAADTLQFAGRVFLSAFIIVAGGAALAAGLAIGIGSAGTLRKSLEERFRDNRSHDAMESEASNTLWRHL